ncbi:hypothetical protein ACFWVF_33125 [Streptomyces sp. NPDC058659]|uniref:hypothetical protein n=1 Tax=unclassified Streptomyces TaxID=2593676 RepID=UPI003667BD72
MQLRRRPLVLPLPQRVQGLAQAVDFRLASYDRHAPDHTPRHGRSASTFPVLAITRKAKKDLRLKSAQLRVTVDGHAAEAIGSGELLSPRSYRTLLDPGTVGHGGATAKGPASIRLKQTEAKHVGFGVIVVNGWVLQNPSFSGDAAIQAYLPSERLAIVVSTTKTATTPDGNTGEVVAERIAAALAPGTPPAIGRPSGSTGPTVP